MNPTEIAKLYLQEQIGEDLSVFSKPPESLSVQETKLLLVKLRLAYKSASKAHTGGAKELILSLHDNLFESLCEKSEEFREFVLNGSHRFLGGHTRDNVDKYKGIANRFDR